jgi:hypothetical protein
VRAILGDVNIQAHVQFLVGVWESDAWREVWHSLGLRLITDRDLDLPLDVSDVILWQRCQQEEVVLLTANRNADGPDSLEATLRRQNTPKSLPVFTLADAEHLRRSREYADRVAERLLGYLLDIDNYRGTGRLYLP